MALDIEKDAVSCLNAQVSQSKLSRIVTQCFPQLLEQLLYSTDQVGKVPVENGIVRLHKEIQVITQDQDHNMAANKKNLTHR